MEAEKLQNQSVHQQIMDSMTSCMIFDAHFCFCDIPGSKIPRKMVHLYIFQQPSLRKIQKYQGFYSILKIDGSIDKTVALIAE